MLKPWQETAVQACVELFKQNMGDKTRRMLPGAVTLTPESSVEDYHTIEFWTDIAIGLTHDKESIAAGKEIHFHFDFKARDRNAPDILVSLVLKTNPSKVIETLPYCYELRVIKDEVALQYLYQYALPKMVNLLNRRLMWRDLTAVDIVNAPGADERTPMRYRYRTANVPGLWQIKDGKFILYAPDEESIPESASSKRKKSAHQQLPPSIEPVLHTIWKKLTQKTFSKSNTSEPCYWTEGRCEMVPASKINNAYIKVEGITLHALLREVDPVCYETTAENNDEMGVPSTEKQFPDIRVQNPETLPHKQVTIKPRGQFVFYKINAEGEEVIAVEFSQELNSQDHQLQHTPKQPPKQPDAILVLARSFSDTEEDSATVIADSDSEDTFIRQEEVGGMAEAESQSVIPAFTSASDSESDEEWTMRKRAKVAPHQLTRGGTTALLDPARIPTNYQSTQFSIGQNDAADDTESTTSYTSVDDHVSEAPQPPLSPSSSYQPRFYKAPPNSDVDQHDEQADDEDRSVFTLISRLSK